MIECRYTCHACGIHDAKFNVPERQPDEDTHHWMDQMILQLAIAHRLASPLCAATQVTDVKIPFAAHKGARLGEATRQ